jgi:hypothetical protein
MDTTGGGDSSILRSPLDIPNPSISACSAFIVLFGSLGVDGVTRAGVPGLDDWGVVFAEDAAFFLAAASVEFEKYKQRQELGWSL